MFGIYDKDDDTPDIIVNFAPYIKEIDLIGVYSGYGMYGRINKIADEVYIKEKCEKLGIYYTSCAENWFGSRRLFWSLLSCTLFRRYTLKCRYLKTENGLYRSAKLLV